MKKYKIITSLLCLLCLCACNNIYNGRTESDLKNETSLSIYENTPPDYMYPVNYSSFFEFKQAIQKENEEELLNKFSGFPDEKQADIFRRFIKKLQDEKIPVPCLDGKEMDLRNKEGFSNISLFYSESYGLPWIFYYPSIPSGENFYIKTTFLPEEILSEQKDVTASEAVKILSPNSPNIHNLGEQHKDIYNRVLKLADREVTALICEYKEDGRNSIMFVYDTMLVEVKGDPAIWSDIWFSSLSWEHFEGNEG